MFLHFRHQCDFDTLHQKNWIFHQRKDIYFMVKEMFCSHAELIVRKKKGYKSHLMVLCLISLSTAAAMFLCSSCCFFSLCPSLFCQKQNFVMVMHHRIKALFADKMWKFMNCNMSDTCFSLWDFSMILVFFVSCWLFVSVKWWTVRTVDLDVGSLLLSF